MSIMFEFSVEQLPLYSIDKNRQLFEIKIKWTEEFKNKYPFCRSLNEFPGNLNDEFTCRILTAKSKKELIELLTSLRDGGAVPGQAYNAIGIALLSIKTNSICFYKEGADLEKVHEEMKYLSWNRIDFSSKDELAPGSELESSMTSNLVNNDKLLDNLKHAMTARLDNSHNI